MSSQYGARGAPAMSSRATGGGLGNRTPQGYSQGRMQNFTPEQIQLFQQMFGNVSPDSFTGKLAAGDEGIFNQLEAPALKQFAGLQGNLASRFSGMGGGQGQRGLGSQKSSGFQNAMNQASSDFASKLQSNRLGLQQGAIKDLMGYSNQLLQQKPYENYLTKDQDFLSQILGAGGDVAGILAKILPFLL